MPIGQHSDGRYIDALVHARSTSLKYSATIHQSRRNRDDWERYVNRAEGRGRGGERNSVGKGKRAAGGGDGGGGGGGGGAADEGDGSGGNGAGGAGQGGGGDGGGVGGVEGRATRSLKIGG
ncbi:hypothetical protein ANTPLA_LOCUS3213 [Anthophora plagiata]